MLKPPSVLPCVAALLLTFGIASDSRASEDYGWGTAQSEREAMLDCITYLQTYNL